MMKDYIERFTEPMMEYYRQTYANSRRWEGEEIQGKRILVYMEQGIGDQIMTLRFLRLVKEKSPESITLHAPKELERLVRHLGYGFVEKEDPNLPEHDYHVCSLSLPFVLKKPIPIEPYIKLIEKAEIDKGFNIGIAWEGNPDHPYNLKRSCSLNYFRPLLQSEAKVYFLQPTIHEWSLVENANDFPLLGVEINDWYDTAKLVNALDYVVSVDTGVLHLAGAMGKKAVALLGPNEPDPRWNDLWYPTVYFARGSWEDCMKVAVERISQ